MFCLFPVVLPCFFTLLLLPQTGTASSVLPNKPFYVVWNHPSAGCSGFHIPFGDYGIVDNAKDRFIGEKMALFYGLGIWPSIGKPGQFRNGGIPQRANLTIHFDQIRRQVQQHIPDHDFSGLAVIDMEGWRPIYGTDYSSFRKYQWESQKYAGERFPKLTKKQIMAKARDEWNDAAGKMMGETLKLVTKLRPNGKWGYYGYPRPWINQDATVRINDRQNYIWNITTGLYPSIYFSLQATPAGRQAMIKSKISETLRVKNKFCHKDTPVLPYTLSQNGAYGLFDEAKLADSIGLPAEMGASGVVIWGASADLHRPNACQILKNHIKNTVGPYVLKLTNFFGNCSQQLCHGNGRCVRKDFVNLHQRDLETSSRATEDRLASSESFERRDSKRQELGLSDGEPLSVRDAPVGYDFDDYACSCYTGSTGSRCDQKE